MSIQTNGPRYTARPLSRRRLLYGATAGGTGLAVAMGACGGGRKAPAPGSGATSGAGGSGQTARPQPGGTFSQRLFTDPSAFDIHQLVTYVAVWPEAPAYNQLLQFDPQNPDSKVIPDLADSYEVSADGTSIVFKLHPGVTFHDGSGCAGDDVKANIDWIKNPPPGKSSSRQATLAVVERVETPDPLTARFVLARPAPSLIGQLATNYMVIGAKGDLAKGDLGTQLNGTGPFKLKHFTRGVSVELERFPGFWAKDRPYLDAVRFAVIADDNTAFTDFLAGKFQRFHPVLTENAGRVERETGGKARVVSTLSTNPDLVIFNGTRKPFNDVRVRRAVSLTLDRQAAIQVIDQGQGKPGGYLLPGGQWALSEQQLKQVPGYDKPDIAAAKQLLAAAGVTVPVSGAILTRTDQHFRDMATFVQGSLQKALGWNFQLDIKDPAAYTDAARAGQFDLQVAPRPSAVDDPDGILADIAISTGPANLSKISLPETDDLFEKQSQTLDLAQRRQLVQELELKLLNLFQVVGLGFPQVQHGVWGTLQNYKIAASLFVNQRYQDVWLSEA